MSSYFENQLVNMTTDEIIAELISNAHNYDSDDTSGHNDHNIRIMSLCLDELRERNYKLCYADNDE